MIEASPFDIESHFGSLKDPRFKHYSPHALIEIVVIALCAIIGSATLTTGLWRQRLGGY